MKSYELFKDNLLIDVEIKTAYDELGLEYIIVEKLIQQGC